MGIDISKTTLNSSVMLILTKFWLFERRQKTDQIFEKLQFLWKIDTPLSTSENNTTLHLGKFYQ